MSITPGRQDVIQQSSTGTMLKCPYDKLFIYYIDGIVSEIGHAWGRNFLGNWVEDGFSFLFFSEPSDGIVCGLIEGDSGLKLVDQYQMSYDDWLGEKPASFDIGNFTISPPWDMPETLFLPNFGAFHIVLDPGVVFGTGTHPTTHDCLELIESAVKNHTIGRVVDLGTGTGLLAIAAAKYKCDKILAVDFNYLAVKTALRNIRLNGFADRIIAVQGLAETFIDVDADLLIANIHYDVMKTIIASKGFLDKKQFILSGLLRSQAAMVEEALGRMPVDVVEKRSPDGVWYTFYGRRI